MLFHVDHAGLEGDALGDLVGVVRGRDTGANVEELAYPGVGGEVAYGAAEERPVRPVPMAISGQTLSAASTAARSAA